MNQKTRPPMAHTVIHQCSRFFVWAHHVHTAMQASVLHCKLSSHPVILIQCSKSRRSIYFWCIAQPLRRAVPQETWLKKISYGILLWYLLGSEFREDSTKINYDKFTDLTWLYFVTREKRETPNLKGTNPLPLEGPVWSELKGDHSHVNEWMQEQKPPIPKALKPERNTLAAAASYLSMQQNSMHSIFHIPWTCDVMFSTSKF